MSDRKVKLEKQQKSKKGTLSRFTFKRVSNNSDLMDSAVDKSIHD